MARQKHLRIAFLSIALFTPIATPIAAPPVPPVAIVGVRVQAKYDRTELYFGRSIAGGGYVSDQEWEGFLADFVTPRFPNGFTVVPAQGRYRGRDGSLVQEQSELLIVLYPVQRRISSSRKIEEIRRAYKRLFKQESVLRSDVLRVAVDF